MIYSRCLLLPSFLLCNCFVSQVNCDWNPKIYNAIKWTAPNQGQRTIAYTTENGITRIPVAYHGGVDTNASGEITTQNIDQFSQWVHQYLPPEYCGPVVMDYEQPWWKELREKTILPVRLLEILSVYIEGAQVARDIQPTAQWGYWGLPSLRHTGNAWREQKLSLEPLIRQCKALYPDVYNCTLGKDNTSQMQSHISSALEMAAGRIPVYVFVSIRYCGKDVDHSIFVPDDIFLKQANAAMRASWVDENGVQHRIKGIVLWDAYGFSPEEEWSDLDKRHAYCFQLLQALANAWTETMEGKEISVGSVPSGICQYGLPEPANSGEAIYDKSLITPDIHNHGNRLQNEAIEDERLPIGRIRPDRVPQ